MQRYNASHESDAHLDNASQRLSRLLVDYLSVPFVLRGCGLGIVGVIIAETLEDRCFYGFAQVALRACSVRPPVLSCR